MGWADLLSTPDTRVLPWLGGRTVYGKHRRWTLRGDLPSEIGWQRFEISGGKRARWIEADFPDLDFDQGRAAVRGYLVGDRMIADTLAVPSDVLAIADNTERVFMVEPGLDRFSRALTVRNGDGQLIFMRQEFPEGPEHEVTEAWQDRRESVDHVPGVTPALELAFQWLTWQRMLSDERQEAARIRAEAEAQRQRHQSMVQAAAEHRQQIRTHFADAARAALARSGAELLDTREDFNRNRIVQLRYRRRRFECVVHPETLQIIEAGICLVDSASGERGDERFTLESLPSVIGEAMDRNVLHVFRHV
jgi:hypothetical protein